MLQAKVSELKTVIEQQKQNEEKLIIKMSQTILQKEQELEEAKREMRFSQTPNALEELNEVDKSVLQDVGGKPIRTQEILTPEISVRNESIDFACIFIPRALRIHYKPMNNNSELHKIGCNNPVNELM
jgi:hypothetical protein